MKYSVDETTKTITVEGNPSLFAFVEMMNKRFPNDEWKKYDIEIKADTRTDRRYVRYPNIPEIYGELAGHRVRHYIDKPNDWSWEKFIVLLKTTYPSGVVVGSKRDYETPPADSSGQAPPIYPSNTTSST